MITRREFFRDMFGLVAGAGLLGLPVWDWMTERDRVERFARTMMGTNVEMALIGLDRDAATSVANRAFAAMTSVANRFTVFDPGSALSEINAAAGSGPVSIDADLETVLIEAETIRSRTKGAFTPAILPLTRLWRPTAARVPEPDAIERAVEAVERGWLSLPGTGLADLGPETQLDLGGIAKGYSVDQAVRVLREAGVTSGIVDAGGDLRLLGSRLGRPWRVGIPDPSRPDMIARVLHLRDAAVATSGDYERFFIDNGTRYHHIVDPRTGYPARESRSFTVVLSDGISADVVSTAAFVLGPEAGLEFATRLGGESLAADAGGTWVHTRGLDDQEV